MNRPLLIALLLLPLFGTAQDVVIKVQAPAYADRPIILYQYEDLFTLRCKRLGTALISSDGNAELSAIVSGTARLRLRIGEVFGDLYARPGGRYQITFPPPEYRVAQSLNGTTRTELMFDGLDALDVNALTSDLNNRIDGFIAEDLATDEVGGMQAVDLQRKQNGQQPDSAKRPATLFVTPTLSAARIDTFETKVRHFYRDVHDPWFAHYIDYSLAGMRYGPRINEAKLFTTVLNGRPVLYDDPEYVRFLRSFFAEHLLVAQRNDGTAYQRAFDLGSTDSLEFQLAKNEFLKDDRLCELVMIDLLYQQYNTKAVVRSGADKILARVAEGSTYPEHRMIAANMLWDLKAMSNGTRLPSMRLEDLRGKEVELDSLLKGATCVVLTASWCSYCDLEMQGFDQLHTEYKDFLPIIAISLDQDLATAKAYAKAHPTMDFRWLHAVAEQQLRDDLRIKSMPAVFLLNDGVLARSPAPLPSNGLGAVFHQAKVEAEKGERVKVWDD